MPIHFVTPLGIFRRVEDGWSPRQEIVLDREGKIERERRQALSPVKLPTHEVLSHAIVYPVISLLMDNLGEDRSTRVPAGGCVLYEWLGPADSYSKLTVYHQEISAIEGASRQRTAAILTADAVVVLGLLLAVDKTLVVDFVGPAFPS